MPERRSSRSKRRPQGPVSESRVWGQSPDTARGDGQPCEAAPRLVSVGGPPSRPMFPGRVLRGHGRGQSPDVAGKSAADGRHVAVAIARGRREGVEAGELVGCQLELAGPRVLLDPRRMSTARDRDDVAALGEHPGE